MKGLTVDRRTGLMPAARYLPSPNRDARSDPGDIDLVVVHAISLPPGRFGGTAIDRLFTNRLESDEHPFFAEIAGLRVSAHLLIRRDGELVQYVPFHERAWHAGESSWGGRDCCNDYSIGIELEGSEDCPFESVQYECLASVVAALMSAYPRITRERIVGHDDIAPGRKTDPGPCFAWPELVRALQRPPR